MSGEKREQVALPLENGWTLSVANDISGHGYSVVAWPTDDPNVQSSGERRWFPFKSGTGEERVWSVEFLMAAMREVAAAKPPAQRRKQAS